MSDTTTLTKADLRQFTGSEHWYRHALNCKVLFTDSPPSERMRIIRGLRWNHSAHALAGGNRAGTTLMTPLICQTAPKT